VKCGNIIKRTQRIFGDTVESQIFVDDIFDWINEAMRQIARDTEVLEGETDLNTSSSTGEITLPIDFIRAKRVNYLGQWIQQTTLADLDRVDFPNDALKVVNGQFANLWYVWGNKLHIYPDPGLNQTGAIHLWYVRLPLEVNTQDDIPEIPDYMHEDLVRFCLMRARELNEEYDQSAKIEQEWKNRVAQTKEQSQNPYANSYPAVRQWDGDSFW